MRERHPVVEPKQGALVPQRQPHLLQVFAARPLFDRHLDVLHTLEELLGQGVEGVGDQSGEACRRPRHDASLPGQAVE